MTSKHANIAIIPARGGSKRLPRKNIVEIEGKPVLAWSVAAALDCHLFDRVIVSTDDEEIAAVGRQAGAEVLMRPSDLGGDNVTVERVCLHVLEQDRQERGQHADAFCCLYATGALRLPTDIANAHTLLVPGQFDFVMSVKEYESSPYQALAVSADNGLQLMWPDLCFTPRTQRPPVVVDAGSIYWCTTAAFLAAPNFYGPSLRGYPLPRERAVDLDTEEDLVMMRYFAAMGRRDG